MKKVVINKHSKYTRNDKEFLKAEVNGDLVMMCTVDGSYWGLNKTSTEIWNLLEEELTFKIIVSKLMEKYDVKEEICKKETMTVLRTMIQNGVILVNEKIE